MKELICTCAHSNYLHEIADRARCLAYVNKDTKKEALCECMTHLEQTRAANNLMTV